MKKFLSLLICTMAVLGLCSCGNDNTSSQVNSSAGSSTNSEVKNEPQNTSKKVSVTDLEKHAETPGSDFSYRELTEESIIITGYKGSNSVVVIPEQIDGKKVEEIEKWTFANDSIVTAVKFPNSLKKMEEGVFANNSNIQSVILGDGLEIISESTFLNSGISEVKLGVNIKTIESIAFSACKNLRNIYIPENVENIDYGAFFDLKDFAIQGKAGSAAESYAKENNFKFEAK